MDPLILFFIGLYVIYLILKNRDISECIEISFIPSKYNSISSYSDIANFVTNTKIYYSYNMESYTDMLNSMLVFLNLYEQIVNFRMLYCKENVDESIKWARNIKNNFNTMIYSIPPNKCSESKFHRDSVLLNSVLNKYLDKIFRKCNKTSVLKYSLDDVQPFNFNYCKASQEVKTTFEYY